MSEYYCSSCNHRHTHVNRANNGNWYCSHCGHTNTIKESVAARQMHPATRARVDAAIAMLSGMVQAQALPLVSLLETWWENTPKETQKRFLEALSWRLVHVIEMGRIDDKIMRALDSYAISEEIFSQDRQPLIEAIARRFEAHAEKKGIDSFGIGGDIKQAYKDVVREAALEAARSNREVIEAAVRDRMPSIEEMTRKIVEEVTNETAREVRDRMRRKG